jgi:sialate O-acetylesterase
MRYTLLFLLLIPAFASAQLQLAKIFSSNMVLQRDQPIHFWGRALPGDSIYVSFAGAEKFAVAKSDSSWMLFFGKQPASKHGQSAVVRSGNQKIVLTNILMGDIWLCIGQSNMQFSMREEVNFKSEVMQSNQAMMRFYNPSFIGKNVFGTSYSDSMIARLNVSDFYERTSWQESDSNSVKAMSAVGYFFGKKIMQSEQIPIGLIHMAIGGCPIETFMSRDALKNSEKFSAKASGNWLENSTLPVWVRERGMQNVGAVKNVEADDLGPNHAYKPGFAYASGIEPILKLPIKGILWYQGESNAQEMERVNEYADLQLLMIEDYRAKWRMPKMPFYWVQLSSIDTVKYKGQLWPQFRDEQRKLIARIPHGGMAVCSDIGFRDNVHPTNKKDVGERLASWALSKTYHRSVVPSGPLPLLVKYEQNKILIRFLYGGGRLKTSDEKALRGFSINGRDDVEAFIEGETIVIPGIKKPEFVYYGWRPFSDGNLLNEASLPASTFKMKVQ